MLYIHHSSQVSPKYCTLEVLPANIGDAKGLVAETTIVAEEHQPDHPVDTQMLPLLLSPGADSAVKRRRRKIKRRCLAMKQIVQFGDMSAVETPHRAVQPSTGYSKKEMSRRRSMMVKSGTITFPGKVIIEEREGALQYAQRETGLASKERMVLWTDGSRFRNDRLAGAAVVFQRAGSSEWINNSFTLEGELFAGSEDSELFAIKAAIEIAAETISRDKEQGIAHVPITELVIYCDCSSVLANIAAWEPYTELATHIREPLFRIIARTAAGLRKLGVQIELRWVPGHTQLPGNEQAHSIAQRAARASDPTVSTAVV